MQKAAAEGHDVAAQTTEAAHATERANWTSVLSGHAAALEAEKVSGGEKLAGVESALEACKAALQRQVRTPRPQIPNPEP